VGVGARAEAGDEINIVERGRNYGWGVATRGRQPGITKVSEPGMIDPIVYYIRRFAPSGISFYSGDSISRLEEHQPVRRWLAGQALRRLEIDGDKVTSQEVIFDQFGAFAMSCRDRTDTCIWRFSTRQVRARTTGWSLRRRGSWCGWSRYADGHVVAAVSRGLNPRQRRDRKRNRAQEC
jgi:hypothetical protein